MAIRRNISVLNEGIIADIDIVYGSDLIPIEFYITDYAIPSNAIAVLYCTKGADQTFKSIGVIENNVISFSPTNGFFSVGKNNLQIRVTVDEKNLYSFEIKVNCKPNMASDDAQEVESQPTLVAQLITEVANTKKYANEALTEAEYTYSLIGEDKLQNKTIGENFESVYGRLFDLEAFTSSIFDNIYPIGSIYMSVNNVNPAELFGIGEWEPIRDRFLVSAGEQFDAGTTGGKSAYTLSAAIGAINGDSSAIAYIATDKTPLQNAESPTYVVRGSTSGGSGTFWNHSTPVTDLYGRGSRNTEILPPYMAVYMWKRIE